MSYMYALPGMPIIRSEDVAIRNSTLISKLASIDKVYLSTRGSKPICNGSSRCIPATGGPATYSQVLETLMKIIAIVTAVVSLSV